MKTLESRIKEQARALGFELVGIAPAVPADGFERMREWLDQGYAGEMSYMYRRAEARRHPDSILPEVRSVIMVAMNYADDVSASGVAPSPPRPLVPSHGKVARYARGEDYHRVLWRKLNQLLEWIQLGAPG